jgi:hypothetical protein
MSLDRDDELLTALSQGVRPDPDDAMIEMLADWHADLDDDLPPLPVVKRRRWFARPIALGLAAGALILGATTAAAATAQPGSPLWPITQAVYPHQAHERSAAQAATRLLDQADAAIKDHRYNDAVTALTDASRQINLVTDAPVHERLVQRWVNLRALLLALQSTGTPSAAPVPSPNTSGGSSSAPQPAPAPPPSPSRSARTSGGVQPLPLPSQPLPLPSLPLPLPSLPLPSLPPLLP